MLPKASPKCTCKTAFILGLGDHILISNDYENKLIKEKMIIVLHFFLFSTVHTPRGAWTPVV